MTVAALFVALVFLWLVKDCPKKALIFFVPPVVALALAFMWTHYLSTGTFDLRYLHYRFGDPMRFQWPGSHWINPQGVDAASDPTPLYLFHFTFGHHGIFSLTPIFLFGIYGMMTRGGMRAVKAIGLILTVALLVFYVATTHNYGGGAHGARWFIWLTPFWLIAMAPVIDKWFERSKAFRVVALAALLISMASVGFALSSRGVAGFMGPWGAGWM